MTNMMQGVKLDGSADSGYGVKLSGFHCSVHEFPKKLATFEKFDSEYVIMAQCESNGYTTFLAAFDGHNLTGDQKGQFASYRREPHQFFLDLDHFLKSLKVRMILGMTLSESHGSLGLTLLYLAAPEDLGNAGV